MEWVCTNCQRTYHESPEACQLCGHEVIVPENDPRARASFLEELRWRLLDPIRADTSLVSDNVYLVWAVRVLFVASFLLLVVALLA